MDLTMNSNLIEQVADPISAWFQYGIVGAVFASVLGTITVPLIKSLITQNQQAIDLLRQSVENNTHAVEELRSVRSENHEAFTEILHKIDLLIDKR